MNNVEFIEVAWSLMILSGQYPAITNVAARFREYKRLREASINHGAQFVSLGYIIADGVVLNVMLACQVVGILAMFLPTDDDPTTVIGRATAWILFSVGFMVVIVAWIIYYIRRRYRDYLVAKLLVDKGENL